MGEKCTNLPRHKIDTDAVRPNKEQPARFTLREPEGNRPPNTGHDQGGKNRAHRESMASNVVLVKLIGR